MGYVITFMLGSWFGLVMAAVLMAGDDDADLH